MATNKPERTKDQLIIDPILESLCNNILKLTKERDSLIKEKHKLEAELAEKTKKIKKAKN